MKKYILFLVSLIAFVSCMNTKEIDIQYQVNVTIDPSTVLSEFHGYSVGDEKYGLDMDEDSQLLITSLIYDNAGNLVEKKESLVADYNSSSKYTVNMREGEDYTVVAVTFSVDNENDINSYLLENESRLDKLTITSSIKNGNSFYSNWSMLGIATKTINSHNKENLISVKPASAIVVLTYKDIHAFDEAGVDTHWIAYKNNVQAKFDNGQLGFVATTAVNSGWVHSLDVTENPNSTNIFVMLNLLPTTNMTVWGGFTVGEDEFTYSEFLEYCEIDPSLGMAVLDIEAGKEYKFDVNCGECTVDAGTLTRACTGLQLNQAVNDAVNKIDDTETCIYVITPEQSAKVLDLVKKIKQL